MTTKTIKLIVFIALMVHGIGHFQGVFASLGVKINNSKTQKSWLLKGLGENVNKRVCLILYLFTAVFGILAALGFKGWILYGYWEILAIVTAILSSFSLILFPNSLAMFFNKAGAVGINLFVFYSLVFNGNWPSAVFED